MYSYHYFTLFIIFIIDSSLLSQAKYKVTIKKIDKCKDPDPPYPEKSIVDVQVGFYSRNSKTFVSGNLTIKEDMQNYLWRIKEGIKTNKGIKYLTDLKKLTCKSLLPRLIITAAKIKHDVKVCNIFKGKYNFEIDADKIDKGMAYFPLREVGDSFVFVGIHGLRGMAACFDIHVVYEDV